MKFITLTLKGSDEFISINIDHIIHIQYEVEKINEDKFIEFSKILLSNNTEIICNEDPKFNRKRIQRTI